MGTILDKINSWHEDYLEKCEKAGVEPKHIYDDFPTHEQEVDEILRHMKDD